MKPITKDYKFISILLRIFEISKNTKNIYDGFTLKKGKKQTISHRNFVQTLDTIKKQTISHRNFVQTLDTIKKTY